MALYPGPFLWDIYNIKKSFGSKHFIINISPLSNTAEAWLFQDRTLDLPSPCQAKDFLIFYGLFLPCSWGNF